MKVSRVLYFGIIVLLGFVGSVEASPVRVFNIATGELSVILRVVGSQCTISQTVRSQEFCLQQFSSPLDLSSYSMVYFTITGGISQGVTLNLKMKDRVGRAWVLRQPLRMQGVSQTLGFSCDAAQWQSVLGKPPIVTGKQIGRAHV